MAIASPSHDWSSTAGLRERIERLLPGLLALAYPFVLRAFTYSISGIVAADGVPDIGAWVGCILALSVAFAVPIVTLLLAMKLTEIAHPSIAALRAKKIAFLAVGAPPLFVFLGVVMYMLSLPNGDIWVWAGGWALALLWVAGGDVRGQATLRQAVSPVWVRYAHGVSALSILLLFLSLHLTNHLFFIAGQQADMAVMKLFRHVYRSNLIQPLIVGLFLFQVASGLFMVSRIRSNGIDRFRTFQIASGVFLAIYVLGHMDSVFIYARSFAGIESDWAFATGAPTGLLEDAWNIRLVPHYGLAVFFVLSHLFAGARVIMLKHGVGKDFADGFMVSGATFAVAVAFFIMLGMCGGRLDFALPA